MKDSKSKKDSNKNQEDTVSLLRSMFRPNQDILTVSTLGEIAKENKGDIDKCVDTILDLLNDPLEVARKEQMEEAQEELVTLRREQQARLAQLQAQVDQEDHDDDDDDDDDDEHFADSKEALAFDAKIEELADRARQKVHARGKKNARGSRGKGRGKAEKARLVAVQQLTRDLEERAEEEALALAERMAKLETERKQRLEREINVLKANHDQSFQDKVEAEVARRLASVEQQVRDRREQEVSAGAPAAPCVTLDDAAERVVELEVSADFAEPGDKVTVTWRYKRGEADKSDWIALYKGSRPLDSKSYYMTQYTDGQATGQLTFKIPAKLGVCEFRFFAAGRYNLVTRSSPLLVGPRVDLVARTEGSTVVVRKQQVSGSASSYDWVALYDQAESDGRRMVGSYTYVASDADATTLLKLPKTPGTYVVRFFSGYSGYSPLAESNPIVVENNDRLVAAPAVLAAGTPGALAVTAEIESISADARNWVAIFRQGEEDVHNFVGGYHYCPSFGVPIAFDVPREKGTFVARFFSRGTFSVVAESNPFTVQ